MPFGSTSRHEQSNERRMGNIVRTQRNDSSVAKLGKTWRFPGQTMISKKKSVNDQPKFSADVCSCRRRNIAWQVPGQQTKPSIGRIISCTSAETRSRNTDHWVALRSENERHRASFDPANPTLPHTIHPSVRPPTHRRATHRLGGIRYGLRDKKSFAELMSAHPVVGSSRVVWRAETLRGSLATATWREHSSARVETAAAAAAVGTTVRHLRR